jgi:hypothetical protein
MDFDKIIRQIPEIHFRLLIGFTINFFIDGKSKQNFYVKYRER